MSDAGADEAGMQGRHWADWIAMILAAILASTSGYLFLRYLDLVEGTATRDDICSTVFQSSCDETLLSSASSLWGIPWAGWGLVYATLILALVGLGRFLGTAARSTLLTTAVIANLTALVVSVYLSYLMLAGVESYCPLCVQTHLINVALVPVLLLARGGGFRAAANDLRNALGYLLGGDNETRDAQIRIVALFCAALIAVVAYQTVLLRVYRVTSGGAAASAADARTTFWDQDPMVVAVSDRDPRLGPANAPVQLVVFSDFQCPVCRTNAKTLEKIASLYPTEVSIVFKHFPLNTACNPLVEVDLHPDACELARLAIAAQEMDIFWRLHDALFRAEDLSSPAAVDDVLQSIGVDPSVLRDAADADSTRAKLNADVDLGINLEVNETPYLFLNGRGLDSTLRGELGALIREHLDAAP